ncbi:peptidoglycan DD-metalloendopeptidase family protein [Actinoplanes utahensis]|uniref:peptidoglycan DD-metalloendopeptidase family protein n=1 Tax=Actinoplanes utahensis TaxID=1869 RepID=UPI0006900116|nr:peptidoglycan DD-metalloendopeptidase family protein [Actinoplanes utahensis]GIF31561.1 hypothetical protein Aut01nite_45470 [Actinoplanes utahensis]
MRFIDAAKRAALFGLVAGVSYTGLAAPAAADPTTDLGAGVAAAAGAKPAFQAPFPCGQRFVSYPWGKHWPALDLDRVPETATLGNPVVASAAGTAWYSGYDSGAGHTVVLKHSGGWFTTYMHLQRRDVPRGATVKQGQRLGLAGQSGTNGKSPHLHYEQMHDDNNNGSVAWGTKGPERKAVVFGGRAVPNRNGYQLTSGNCAKPAPSAGIGVFRPSGGQWIVPGKVLRKGWGNRGDQPLVGDFNGDRKADVAVFRPSTKTWHQPGRIWLKNWGNKGDLAVTGDFNRDGKDEPAVFRPSTKTWYTPGKVLRKNWGVKGDVPLAGDFNGDGRDEIAVYRPSNGTWYTPGKVLRKNWGLRGDKPIVGDFNRDGKDEIGVYRPSNKTWYTPGKILRQNWGASGDVPLAGF